jgi:hypothetical protein
MKFPKPIPPRGRPRAFDEDAALKKAMEVFWSKGFQVAELALRQLPKAEALRGKMPGGRGMTPSALRK